MKNKKSIVRAIILGLAAVSGFFAVITALAELYTPQSAAVHAETESVVRTVVIPASRGEIYDRNGTALVTNRVEYTLEFDYFNFDSSRRCVLVHDVLQLLREYNIPYTDSMPITNAPFAFTQQSDDFAAFLKTRGIDSMSDAGAVIKALCNSYAIPARYTPDEARAILGVFYELYLHDFSAQNPYTIARGVSADLIAVIREQDETFHGVQVGTGAVREYDTAYCAHILGRVGAIPAEQLEDYLALGYAYDARVGIDGAERAFENILRGTKGELVAETDTDGNILRILSQTAPKSGENVYLTIDFSLQRAAEDALARRIEALRGDGEDADGGAVVVLDVNTAEILALASYPTFSLADFSETYAALVNHPQKPMFNRAIAGVYAPGSTYKMLTAAAALADGVILPDTVISCEGIYDYFAPEYLYRCWIYNERGQTHGPLTVGEALANSCNCFFYETGRLCGIDRIAEFAKLFGLGEYTGIELGGEARGTVACREVREAGGRGFYAGDTLQAAIGQSDNLFTPLQLANYVTTLINGGIRRAPHILLRTETAANGAVQFEQTAQIVETIDLDEECWDAILEGMLSVTADGTASGVFENYPVAVLGKSGSAQVSDGAANAIFVLAAPAENPQIAIAVVIEHGALGNNAALVARDILDMYISENSAKTR